MANHTSSAKDYQQSRAASTRTADAAQLIDPRSRFQKPPFDQQSKFKLPGSSRQMKPTPDHGEESYVGSGKLKGLNAIITGGDSGIGRATAIAFAREGANVAIAYLSETDDARETVNWIEKAGSKALAIEGDLREEDFCQQVVARTVKEFGSLEVLINNAAHQELRDSVEEFSTELFDKIFKVNVYANFWLSRAAMKHLPAGGSIINTVSIQGYTPTGELLAYAATKSALIGMTKAMAKLAIKEGIRVNGVAPGPVWTPLIPGSMSQQKIENFGENTLFERPAQPAELAPLFVWLASPDASYVTAEIFSATGGRTPV